MNLIQKAMEDRCLVYDQEKRYVVYLPHACRRSMDNPEEHVQLEAFLALIYHYNYPPHRIKVCPAIQMGAVLREADIIVYEDDECKSPYIIVECKRRDLPDTHFKLAIDQAFSYAASNSAEYVWITSGRRSEYFEVWQNRIMERSQNHIHDIPYYQETPMYSAAQNAITEHPQDPNTSTSNTIDEDSISDNDPNFDTMNFDDEPDFNEPDDHQEPDSPAAPTPSNGGNPKRRWNVPKVPANVQAMRARVSPTAQGVFEKLQGNVILTDTFLYGLILTILMGAFSKLIVFRFQGFYDLTRWLWENDLLGFHFLYNVVVVLSFVLSLLFGAVFMQNHKLFAQQRMYSPLSFKRYDLILLGVILFLPVWFMGITTIDSEWWTLENFQGMSYKTKIFMWPFFQSLPLVLIAVYGISWIIQKRGRTVLPPSGFND